MTERLAILSLHRMGDPRYRREAVRALEYMAADYAPQADCIVHDADLPLPPWLRDIDYHAILLGPTFLCSRFDPAHFARTLAAYDFVRTSPACKVALPQDDYRCCALLDRWMSEWRVDRVYSVCPPATWAVLYPDYARLGEIRPGYTGYIPEAWLHAWAAPKEHAWRRIDVSYRASDLPANFGRVGRLKAEIGRRFLAGLPPGHGLVVDISTDRRDLIPGAAWHAFLEESKFCLTAPSGSSLLDPHGRLERCVRLYKEREPDATFAAIEAHCFPGDDGRYLLTAISPRNIEAALAETVQIATPGAYSGLLRPLEHFIPLAPDCSNIAEVLAMMADPELVRRIGRDCKEAVLAEPRLRFRHFMAEVAGFIADTAAVRHLAGPQREAMARAVARYRRDSAPAARRYWRRRRVVDGLRAVAVRLGARRIKRVLEGHSG